MNIFNFWKKLPRSANGELDDEFMYGFERKNGFWSLKVPSWTLAIFAATTTWNSSLAKKSNFMRIGVLKIVFVYSFVKNIWFLWGIPLTRKSGIFQEYDKNWERGTFDLIFFLNVLMKINKSRKLGKVKWRCKIWIWVGLSMVHSPYISI